MDASLRKKLVAALVGAGAVGALGFAGLVAVPALTQVALASQPAAAGGLRIDWPSSPGRALSTTLAKFDGNYYAIGTEPGISLDPQSTTTVRKIEYGRTSFVNVVTTSSGTYSTDGLTSPHVRYPGVYTERLRLHFRPFSGDIFGWSKLTGWTKIPLFAAHSFGFLDTAEVPQSQDGVCVADTHEGGCR